jgi:hypothetical protein
VRSSINDYGVTTTGSSPGAANGTHSNYMDPARQQAAGGRFYAAAPKGAAAYPPSAARRAMQTTATDGQHHANEQAMQRRYRSKSSYNIYAATPRPPMSSSRYNSSNNNGERYNNSSSIYSPGHMLVPHSAAADQPPKLPPRDFVVAKRSAAAQKSKSSGNISGNGNYHHDDQSENIYSTRLAMLGEQAAGQLGPSAAAMDDADKPAPGSTSGPPVEAQAPAKPAQRKPKRNRFLESLKAPLELAKSSGRSASVLSVPVSSAASELTTGGPPEVAGGKKSAKTKGAAGGNGNGFSKAKNIRSFLGVGKSGKQASGAAGESNYVHAAANETTAPASRRPAGATKSKSSNNKQHDGGVDSAVDSSDELDNGHHRALASSPAASYNDLDIPTPDYETDENIYALDDACNNYIASADGKSGKSKPKSGTCSRARRYSTSNNNNNGHEHDHNHNHDDQPETSHAGPPPKDDLYYSGFRAHVPQHHHSHLHPLGSSTMGRANEQQLACDQAPASAANSRYLMRTSRMLAAKMSGRDLIYGSTLGLQQQRSALAAGARYRSASMQRHYPGGAGSRSQQRLAGGGSQLYDADCENPYAMSAGFGSALSAGGPLDEPLGGGGQPSAHYGVTTASSCIGGAGTGQRGSISKLAQSRGLLAGHQPDLGRSSSGIYGLNSGSSSSEYADWQPQVRKVNSSGYLNSVFKSHQQLGKLVAAPDGQLAPPNGSGGSNNNNNSNNVKTTYHASNDTSKTGTQVRNYAARSLKSTQVMSQEGGAKPAAPSAPAGKKQSAASVLNGPAYRSYDSSNGKWPPAELHRSARLRCEPRSRQPIKPPTN